MGEGPLGPNSIDRSLSTPRFIRTRSLPGEIGSPSPGRFGTKRSGDTGRRNTLIDTVLVLVGDVEDRFFSESFGGDSLAAAEVRRMFMAVMYFVGL